MLQIKLKKAFNFYFKLAKTKIKFSEKLRAGKKNRQNFQIDDIDLGQYSFSP